MLADPRGASIDEIFEAAGALRSGHFLLKSGRHSGRYLEKFAVLQYPSLAVEIGRRLAEALAAQRPSLVVGPTTSVGSTGASAAASRRPISTVSGGYWSTANFSR